MGLRQEGARVDTHAMNSPQSDGTSGPCQSSRQPVTPTTLGVQALAAEFRSSAVHLRARNAMHDVATTEREWHARADVYDEVAARLDALLIEPTLTLA